jgi:Fur family peroxide stress response transcriptional regulator
VDRSEIEGRVAEFVEACHHQGIKATHQRTEILRELVATEEHPGAETIYVRVRQRIPAISLDTVYRTLRMLEAMGMIARVGSVQDRTRFDANPDRHHHFVCRECGTISDFSSDLFDRFPVPRQVAELGDVDSVYVELRGRCGKCRSGATSGKMG